MTNYLINRLKAIKTWCVAKHREDHPITNMARMMYALQLKIEATWLDKLSYDVANGSADAVMVQHEAEVSIRLLNEELRQLRLMFPGWEFPPNLDTRKLAVEMPTPQQKKVETIRKGA